MTPTDLETLRGLVGLSVVTTETPWYCRPSSMTVVLNKSVSPDAVAITLVADCFISLNSDAERKANAQFIAASRNAIPALTALLADYERMREWILEHATHGTEFTQGSEECCTCGLDALRATLKGEKHE